MGRQVSNVNLEENLEFLGIIKVNSFCRSNETMEKTGHSLNCENTNNSLEIVNKDWRFHDFFLNYKM